MVLHVRVAGNSAVALRDVLVQVHATEPDLAVDVQSMGDATQFSLIPLRVAGSVLGFSSVVGLLLATLGVFGLVAYEVTLRTREIGIRMALGAQRTSVLRLAVRRGLRPVFAGLAIGFVGAIGVGLVLRGLLVGIGPVDPVTLAGVGIALLVSAAAAVAGPAWRAVTIDPARVLREE
jgi:ABC-type antimicrobial peptide transport system permease subunit